MKTYSWFLRIQFSLGGFLIKFELPCWSEVTSNWAILWEKDLKHGWTHKFIELVWKTFKPTTHTHSSGYIESHKSYENYLSRVVVVLNFTESPKGWRKIQKLQLTLYYVRIDPFWSHINKIKLATLNRTFKNKDELGH